MLPAVEEEAERPTVACVFRDDAARATERVRAAADSAGLAVRVTPPTTADDYDDDDAREWLLPHAERCVAQRLRRALMRDADYACVAGGLSRDLNAQLRAPTPRTGRRPRATSKSSRRLPRGRPAPRRRRASRRAGARARVLRLVAPLLARVRALQARRGVAWLAALDETHEGFDDVAHAAARARAARARQARGARRRRAVRRDAVRARGRAPRLRPLGAAPTGRGGRSGSARARGRRAAAGRRRRRRRGRAARYARPLERRRDVRRVPDALPRAERRGRRGRDARARRGARLATARRTPAAAPPGCAPTRARSRRRRAASARPSPRRRRRATAARCSCPRPPRRPTRGRRARCSCPRPPRRRTRRGGALFMPASAAALFAAPATELAASAPAASPSRPQTTAHDPASPPADDDDAGRRDAPSLSERSGSARRRRRKRRSARRSRSPRECDGSSADEKSRPLEKTEGHPRRVNERDRDGSPAARAQNHGILPPLFSSFHALIAGISLIFVQKARSPGVTSSAGTPSSVPVPM